VSTKGKSKTIALLVMLLTVLLKLAWELRSKGKRKRSMCSDDLFVDEIVDTLVVQAGHVGAGVHHG
jgi:hypothetical protein